MEYVISVNKGRFEDIFNNPKVIALFENKPILKPAPIYNSCLECFAISVCQALLACPPFVRYVKEKIAETKLDMHMKSLVAQFAAHSIPAAGSGDWPRVSISKLLNSIPGGFNGKCREDAEDWYRQLSKEFYDETFGQVSAYYKTVCHECGKCREINDKSPRVQLRCPDLEITAANIESMLAVTGNEIVTWEHDGCENTTCRETTRYEFPDVILVSVDTFQDGNRHIGKELEFFPTEDFSPISVNNDEPDIFHLGGVIYFRTFNCFRDESSGHYMARVYHHGNVFLADDNRIYEQNINRPTEPANSVPYFAFYYRQRRAGRF
ncbi:USP domain-containing protein [Caenorhabditis elegans]|uniref:USP domain-containing protein n=1 Tax=Caenorhabditis elegans TaxID=6239 RepID=Q966K0_CAEEL|nr:USP domain-containing protein [Caenorhabditis elegans]CCD66250.1 USP domain-containing protein [Caenorhabditis elegans]|eukprot:NP_510749.1 Uncharacterized protein CELE_F35B3.1 [Caenorhabditis elegans]